MSAPAVVATAAPKKRSSTDAAAASSAMQCSKKARVDPQHAAALSAVSATAVAQQAAMGAHLAAAGWTYPTMPMGMMPPMPFCFPAAPFFNPFMFPAPFFPFPAMPAAMAGMQLPGLPQPVASAVPAPAGTGVTGSSGGCAPCTSAGAPTPAAVSAYQPAGSMGGGYSMMCGNMMMAFPQPVAPAAAAASAADTMVRASSGVSCLTGGAAAACSNNSSAPTMPLAGSPAGSLNASSPLSVCCGNDEAAHEDDEFASFIDSFIKTNSNSGDASGNASTGLWDPLATGGSDTDGLPAGP